MSDIDLPIPFKRLYEGPIDSSMVFSSIDELNAYLTNPARYAGQTASVLSGTEVYFYALTPDKSTWKFIGSTDNTLVTSVNTKTGDVILDPDDLDDSNTTNKFVTQSQLDTINSLDVIDGGTF